MNTATTTPKPILAAIDTSASGLTALRMAAHEANARQLPLSLFLTRPTTIWTNPIAMAPHRGRLVAEDHIIGQAKTLVSEIRTTYPALTVSAVVTGDATTSLRRESGRASMLFEAADQQRLGILGRTRKSASARCPIVQTAGLPITTAGDRVVVIGSGPEIGSDSEVEPATLALANAEASRRALPVTVTRPGEPVGNAALVVTTAPRRRGQAAHRTLLASAPCPVLISPR